MSTELIHIEFRGTPKEFGDKYGKLIASESLIGEAILATLGTYCIETGNSVEFFDGNGESLFVIEKK